MKQCTKCQEQKEPQDFPLCSRYSDGLFPYCRSCKKLSNKQSYAKHAKTSMITVRRWKALNQEKVKKYEKKYRQTPKRRLAANLRRRQLLALKNKTLSHVSAVKLLGCSIEDCLKHIEAQWQDGMTWDNWTLSGWHLDHIKPLASANTKEEMELLCHYTNLRPLWASDNLSKGGKY